MFAETLYFYHPWSDSEATVVLFSLVSVCGCVCQCDNSWTVWDIIMKFLWEQGMVKSSDEFENVSLSMHWQIGWGGGVNCEDLSDNVGSAIVAHRWWFNVFDVPVYGACASFDVQIAEAQGQGPTLFEWASSNVVRSTSFIHNQILLFS